jgi:UDP-N-acetylmuramate dehydrogenase
MLLTKDIDALVIHIDLKGKRILKKTKIVWVESRKAGMNLYCGLSIKILAV